MTDYDDLVRRLRGHATFPLPWDKPKLHDEAADAIEALHAEVTSLNKQVDETHQISLDVMRERDEARKHTK